MLHLLCQIQRFVALDYKNTLAYSGCILKSIFQFSLPLSDNQADFSY